MEGNVVRQAMKRYVRLGLMVGVPLVIAGWWMFRPEKLFINATVNEAAPAGAKVLASGTFSSEAHPTEGTAELIEAEGRRMLRLSKFMTTNGPDVRVWLVEGETAGSGAEVKKRQHVELGALKGNIGDQNYGIPAEVDLTKYRAVSIWCARFSVQFGGATLTPQ